MALSVYPIYPSDLTDTEWAVLVPLIPAAKPGGRPRSVSMRRIVNGLFYLLRTGCAWHYLPQEYGPWQTIYWGLPPVAARWDLDPDPHAAAGTSSAACRSRSHAERGHHR